ncbi:SpoIIE family protein phosphatase [Spirillospora sp. NPDC047279]|uniref:SpoIIE family protein phosphatase n=1 Tax=Spirillospora sp. NPDC047279 TaxID=3155478 RepID=UPI0033C52E18
MPREESRDTAPSPGAEPRTGDRPAEPAPPVAPAGDPERAARRLAAAIVPRFADLAVVHLFDFRAAAREPRRPVLRTAASAATEAAGHRLAALLAGDLTAGWETADPVPAALARGETVHIHDLDGPTAGFLSVQLGVPGLAGPLRGRSALLLPLRSGGALLGDVLLVTEPDRPAHRPDDLAALEALVSWTADDIANGLLSEDEHPLAHRLWTEAGPELPIRAPGLDLRYRYLPDQTSATGRLGGDWFDVIPLPGGRTALVIGDVAGHGPEAALRMSQCKAMVRTLASLDPAPEVLLLRFDRLIRRLAAEYERYQGLLVTCVYAVYDPEFRRCQIANAGHVPPALVTGEGRCEFVTGAAGVPIGVGGVPFEPCTVDTPDGSLLVLYSDGLVETGHLDIEDGFRAIADRLGRPAGTLDLTCDGLLAELHAGAASGAGERSDDVTLLVARLLGPPADALATPSPSEAAAGDAPPDVAAGAPAAGPPAAEAILVGRDRELIKIDRLLAAARLVTLTGLGGIGKSHLARYAADRCVKGRSGFADGVRIIDLSAVQDPALLLPSVLTALGFVRRPGDVPDETVLRQVMADQRLLLVLDGCEHLAEACAVFVRGLLRAAPGVRVLATSRCPLRVPGEHILVIPPLDEDEALALFRARAARTSPDLGLSGTAEHIARGLCVRLDGIPLAVELAAGRLRRRSLDDLASMTGDPFELLTSEHEVRPMRHRSMRSSIGWSHELCEPAERLLWARLSVFAGTFDLAAAVAVCADDELAPDEILELLGRLVRTSILVAERAPDEEEAGEGGARYRMFDTVRRYGLERLASLDDRRGVRRRHLDHHRRVAVDDGDLWYDKDQAERFDRMELHHRDLRSALEFAFSEPGEARGGLALATALWPHWGIRGFVTEGRTWLSRGLTLETAPSALRTRALWVHGWLAGLQGDQTSALLSLEECCALADRLDDERAGTQALQFSAEIALRRGDRAVAVPLYEEALAGHRALGDTPGIVTCLHQLALCHALSADPGTESGAQDLRLAFVLCDTALDVSATTSDHWRTSATLYSYGVSLWRLGDGRAAERAVLRSLRLKRPLGDRVGIGLGLALLSWIAAERGRPEEAARLTGAAQRIWNETRSPLAGFRQMKRLDDRIWAIVSTSCHDAAERARRAAAEPLAPLLDDLLEGTPPDSAG